MNDQTKIDRIKQWLGTGSINIFGRPFSGKDFQGRRLAELLGATLLGSGDILRKNNLSNEAKLETRSGRMAPTEEYKATVLPYLSKSEFSGKPLVFSSLGRWHGEEQAVLDAALYSGHQLKSVIYLEINEDESHKRWLARDINNDRGSRHDDTEDVLKIRFAEFIDKTQPVIDFYDNQGILVKINGKGDRDKITSDIIDALYKLSLI